MKLFKFTLGIYEQYGVFNDEKEAYEKRATIDPAYYYTPVEIAEVTVPGYEITLKPIGEADPFAGWDKDRLREFLDGKGVKYAAQSGEAKLRELAVQHL